MKARRLLFGILIIPALVAGMMPSSASAQSQDAVPAVEVHPVGTTREDPNGGQWFVTSMSFGERKTLQARFYNPAEIAQTVKLYLADMLFDAAGIPEVAATTDDVGGWGSFDHPTITIQPKQQLIETFTITAPEGVDPGDHVGAVVVEQAPAGTGQIRSIKRLAVRLYATLPGDARKEFEIREVSSQRDSAFFAKELTVTVHLKNTGRVRLEPAVTVDGQGATGPELLMSTTTERYVVKRPVKFWGGPVRLHIDATTQSLGQPGPARQMRVTVWVIPWHLLVLLALAAGAVFAVRWLLRRRAGRLEALQADLRRIERLVTQQTQSAPAPQAVHSNGTAAPADPQGAILAAIKQAKRSGDFATADRLETLLDAQPAVNGHAHAAPSVPSAPPAPAPARPSVWANLR